jgi:hypothetical protein
MSNILIVTVISLVAFHEREQGMLRVVEGQGVKAVT